MPNTDEQQKQKFIELLDSTINSITSIYNGTEPIFEEPHTIDIDRTWMIDMGVLKEKMIGLKGKYSS